MWMLYLKIKYSSAELGFHKFSLTELDIKSQIAVTALQQLHFIIIGLLQPIAGLEDFRLVLLLNADLRKDAPGQ